MSDERADRHLYIVLVTFGIILIGFARRQSVWICATTIAVGWTFAGLLAAAPLFSETLGLGPKYGISGLSCGIRNVYPRSLFFFHLLPVRPGPVTELTFC